MAVVGLSVGDRVWDFFAKKIDVLKTYLWPELDALSTQVYNIEASLRQVGLRFEICILRVPRNMLSKKYFFIMMELVSEGWTAERNRDCIKMSQKRDRVLMIAYIQVMTDLEQKPFHVDERGRCLLRSSPQAFLFPTSQQSANSFAEQSP